MLDWSEYNRWLSSAIKTLESAEKDEDFNWACFKAEQSAQLAVKALLFLLGKPYIGHDLLTLLERTEVQLSSEIVECASFLSKVYIPSRYPDALPEPLTPHLAFTSEDKRKAIECARKIIDLVKSVGEDLRRKEKEEG
ncbi:HEPN domain-containing protein [Sulfurisphaera javensis]|uniref:HEPN domain-containing protein n=1 Tax=Sulfurisphaera javensis TaxID=2049879 RepID=A0AAT9GSS2_9CREN